jgi:hypothetical protein
MTLKRLLTFLSSRQQTESTEHGILISTRLRELLEPAPNTTVESETPSNAQQEFAAER